ncbi:MAG: hypothetical protein K2K21_13385 [Lachnospiraceae bacterium]|nr:hypothetical protein [Lachnospiraceae bacterium]
MESTVYSKHHLNEIADIKGFTIKNVNIQYDRNTVRVNKLILGPDCVTSYTEGPIAPTQFAIIPKKNACLKREFLSFIFESGMFYAYLSARQGKKSVALETSESDLKSFDVPIPTTEIQLLIIKQQVAFEWAKRNINDGYKYSGLRMATYDDIRHILAYELYYPNQTQLMNIHPLKALSGIADILDDPQRLFEILLFERQEMMEQVKRFRSYIQFR